MQWILLDLEDFMGKREDERDHFTLVYESIVGRIGRMLILLLVDREKVISSIFKNYYLDRSHIK